MDTITIMIVGLIVGLGGARIAPWQRGNNVGWSSVFGILGAFGGALIARSLGYSPREAATFVSSILGSVFLVAAYVGIRMRRVA